MATSSPNEPGGGAVRLRGFDSFALASILLALAPIALYVLAVLANPGFTYNFYGIWTVIIAGGGMAGLGAIVTGFASMTRSGVATAWKVAALAAMLLAALELIPLAYVAALNISILYFGACPAGC